MLPARVVRKTFPTVHSTFDTKRLGLAADLSVAMNAPAIAYLERSLLSRWLWLRGVSVSAIVQASR
jgi:hypothetical protein